MEDTKKITKEFLSDQKSTISDKSLLLQLTGEMPLFKIIDFLVENKGMDFSKKDISEGANISRASLFNYWNELEQHGIVKVTRSFGKTKLYTLNSKSIITKRILELEKALISEALAKDSKKEQLVSV
jgi:predicted transcriptional regulator